MTASPNLPNYSEHMFAPRTPHIIGRRRFIEAIRSAIADRTRHSYVFYIVGPGGIGKTRLLEEITVIQAGWAAKPFLQTGIIDLYHIDYHSSGGLSMAIANGLDPEKRFFRKYRELHVEYEQKHQEGAGIRELEIMRHQLDKIFQTEYSFLAKKQRIVLCFDTMELIQYENDVVQEICQVQDMDATIKNWILEQFSQLPRTVILFAGRPRSKTQNDFYNGFTRNNLTFKLIELDSFTESETLSYLDNLSEQRTELTEILTTEVKKHVFQITQGRPIYLTLLIDLLLHGESLRQLFPASSQELYIADEDAIGGQLVEHFWNLPDPLGHMTYFLLHARKGLDYDLIKYLVGDSWSEDQIRANIVQMRNFAFVKTRPRSSQIFLHDEVYDLFDRYFREDPRFRQEYASIAHYYRYKLDSATSLQEREDLTIARMYYELQVNTRVAFRQYYARWDEDAIKNHESSFDMRLRDEVLRFLDRYAKADSPFYDSRIADQIEWPAIDRDCALRWVMRYRVRNEFQKALQVAENLRNSQLPAFQWEGVRDFLYKASLLTDWGIVLIRTSAPAEQARSLLQEAVLLLEDNEGGNEDQRWWRDRVLGRAYNHLGYLYRSVGRYGLALREYQRALPYFKGTNVPDEQADTMNNLAYLLALLGRSNLALNLVRQAFDIRQEIGRKYPLALSRNTRGIIYALQDHPMWGERDCREALRICRELREIRGIGLACIGLGFTLRRRGDQWKLDVYSLEEAEQYFVDAVQYLQRAVEIFSGQVLEPVRLWEGYNELGSLYCDWARLMCQHPDSSEQALEQYQQSVAYQRQALSIAESHHLEFQTADSCDDLAQVLADQSFLLIQLGKVEEAIQNRTEAETFLNRVINTVPEEFHLILGEGFRETLEPGEAYWRSLGKAYLWKGRWGFRDFLTKSASLQEQHEATLKESTQHLILAAAYFQHYWPPSFVLEQALSIFSDLIRVASVSSKWVRSQIEEVAREYRINLNFIEEAVNDVLGLERRE